MKNILMYMSSLLLCSYMFAIGGLGINFGSDLYTIPGGTEEWMVEGGSNPVSIVRTDLESPFYVGGYVYLDFLPVVDIEAGFGFAGNTYDYTYTTPGIDGSLSQTESYKLPWFRSSSYLTIQKPMFTIPMIKLYVGGGLNMSFSLPIVDKSFITSTLSSNLDNASGLNSNSISDLTTESMGIHIEAGARFKPVFIPFSINAKARYNIIGDIIPDKSGLLTITVGAGLAL